MEVNQIYHGDCLELLPLVPDASVDMVLCDLPYGTTQNKWDSVLPLDQLWAQYKRVVKPDGAIVLFAQTPFDKVLGASNLEMLRYEWIWDKGLATGFMNANRAPMKRHENILVFYKASVLYNPQFTAGKPYSIKRRSVGPNYGKLKDVNYTTKSDGKRYPISILQFSKEAGYHPTQKPVSLCEYLIKTYTNPGETVLDNCLGSGTTAIACINTGRQYIGIEKEEKYFNVALERIKKLQREYTQLTFDEGVSA